MFVEASKQNTHTHVFILSFWWVFGERVSSLIRYTLFLRFSLALTQKHKASPCTEDDMAVWHLKPFRNVSRCKSHQLLRRERMKKEHFLLHTKMVMHTHGEIDRENAGMKTICRCCRFKTFFCQPIESSCKILYVWNVWPAGTLRPFFCCCCCCLSRHNSFASVYGVPTKMYN